MVLALFVFSNSQAQDKVRYTQQAPEIETMSAYIKSYNEGDWTKVKSLYAKDAVIIHNTSPKSAPDEFMMRLKNTVANFSTYKLTSEGEEERVVNDKGETWVNVWGDWKGTMKGTGEEISIPVHVTFQFKDGKIIKEYGYHDLSIFHAAFQNVNKIIVQGLYDDFAKGDIPNAMARLDEKAVWNEAEGNKYADGNPYIGSDAIIKGVFARLGADHEYFKLQDIQLTAMDGNKVLATLRYDAKWKNGKAYDAQAAHLWTLANGKVVAFQQYANTKLLADTEQ